MRRFEQGERTCLAAGARLTDSITSIRPERRRGRCLYEVVLRQAIATQHGLATPERLDLRACEGCGKAYLLTSVWLPLS